MTRFTVPLTLFLTGTCLGTYRCLPAHADMTVVDANTAPCPIVTVTRGNSLETRVAKQLAAYLEKISGQPFKLQDANTPLPERAIIVGAHGIESPKDLGPDGFFIKTQGQRLYIVGGKERGTAHGVFAFLQDQLGCRWWSSTEELVPNRPDIKIPGLDIKEKPYFALHDILSREAQTPVNHFVYKSRAQSTLQFSGNHTLYKMMSEAAKANPEFWPMNAQGERKPNDLHFNYLAPGFPEALAVELEKEVEKRKGNLEDFIYFAGQGDWYGGLDQSAPSKAVYAEEGANSGPLVRMMNKTGELLARKYPGIQVGTFAYMSTDAPPNKTRPAANVNIWLPRLRYGITLSLEEAASSKNPDEKTRTRAQNIKASIEKWAQIAPGRLYIWEYGVNYTHFVKPQPVLRAMAQNIKFYREAGVRGIMIQGNYVSPGGDLAVLKNYVWSRLLWNPDLDPEQLLQEFCQGYYGPAAGDILEYVNLLENSVREPRYMQLDEFNTGTGFLTPEVLGKMQAALTRAGDKTRGEANADYHQRVREVGASLEAMDLWRTGPLVEMDGKLIRADINKAGGGEYTHQRALELPKYLRGSSITEFGTGVSQQRNIVAYNGGPVYTLSRGALTAKIAPYQGRQRLWRVLADGKEVISGSQIAPGSAYFIPGAQADQSTMEMEGETGFGNWNPVAEHIQKESVAIDEGGVLVWSGSFRPVNAKATSVTPRADTNYPVATLKEAQTAKVEIKTAAGWKQVPVTEFRAKGLPPLTQTEPVKDFQLRFTSPDGKTVVIDTYRGLSTTGYAVVYAPAAKAITTYVQMDKLETAVLQKEVPAFRRELRLMPTG